MATLSAAVLVAAPIIAVLCFAVAVRGHRRRNKPGVEEAWVDVFVGGLLGVYLLGITAYLAWWD